MIKCEEVIKNDAGDVIELRCTHDAATLGKKPEGRKVKGVIHWVSASAGVVAEVRVYDRLFNVENPASAESLESVLDGQGGVLRGNLSKERRKRGST